MKIRSLHRALAVLLGGLLLLLNHAACLASPREEQAPAHLRWMDWPREIGRIVYFHEVTSWRSIHEQWARDRSVERDADGFLVRRDWKGVFEATHEVPFPALDSPSSNKSWAVVVIEFDSEGWVLTTNAAPGRLRGRLAESLDLQLSTGEGKDASRYWLASWFKGFGKLSERWAPAPCLVSSEIHNRFEEPNGLYLYGKEFRPDSVNRVFGCREWTFQLNDAMRPYIDITNYVRPSKDEPGGHFIHGDFLGWFRHGQIKPVIGQHEDQWYCLLDCPDGERPGPIPDIRAWAKKRGWNAPKPPTRMPVFPDPPARPGIYPK